MTSRLLNGLVLVVLGAVLLMNTTGYLPWTVWDAAWGYWPVLLIGLGLQVALSHWRFPGVALAIVVIVILAAMNPYAGSSPFREWNWRSMPRMPSFRPMEGSKQWSVPLRPSISRLDLQMQAPSMSIEARGDSGLNASSPGIAVSGTLSWDRFEPEASAEESYGLETLKAAVKSPAPDGTDGGKQIWELALNPSLATSWSIRGGVANLGLDMGSAFLESMNVSSGISKLDLSLGLSGKVTRINVTGGFTVVTLRVPEAAGVRISISGPFALTNDFAKQGLTKSGNYWLTPDYENTATKVDLNVVCGTGKITLTRTGWD